MPVLWDPQKEHLSSGLRGQHCSGLGKGKQDKGTLGQRLGPRNGGVRVWAATILSHRGGKPRDQAGEDGHSQSLHTSLSDSAYCSWLPHEGLCEVKEAVFSRNPRAAVSSVPTYQGGSDKTTAVRQKERRRC